MMRHNTFICIVAALTFSVLGCKGKDATKEAPKPTTTTAVETPPKTAPKTTPKATDPITAALAHANRPQADKDRDANRKPGEVLKFLGVKPGMKVADLFALGGYYTELLGRTVGATGKVIAQDEPDMVKRFPKLNDALEKRLEDPALGKIVKHEITGFDALDLPAGELDLVFLANAYHDLAWMHDGKLDRAAINKAIFDSLRPGGIYAIIDHRGPKDNKFSVAKSLHRGDADATKAEVTAAGFVFDSESDILANAEDKPDTIVFDPSIRGKTSRFLYKFKKPAN